MALASASVSRQLSIAFEDAPLWDASSLESVILREAGRPVRLTLTENRSVLLSFRRNHGTVLLRLHRMFLHAPLSSCARWRAACAAPIAAPTVTCAGS